MFLFFAPRKWMAALTYCDHEKLASKLLNGSFFCLTPAEPFFRLDRLKQKPASAAAVKDGRHSNVSTCSALPGHP